jgi:hypothetical protein
VPLVVCVGGNFGVGFSNTTYIGKVGIDYHFVALLEVYLVTLVLLRGNSFSEKFVRFPFFVFIDFVISSSL